MKNNELEIKLEQLIKDVDADFDEFIRRLDKVANLYGFNSKNDGNYKKLYAAAFEVRSTVALVVKSILVED